MTVVSANQDKCLSSRPINVDENEGYLSSYVAKKSGCGLKAPWTINVLPGQQINISIIAFEKITVRHRYIGRKCDVRGYV